MSNALIEELDRIAPSEPEVLPEEEIDLEKLSKKVPPSRGLCRRCGENKPINRLMLCYPCWVKDKLEQNGWREGQPHPDDCNCESIGTHGRKSDGN